MADLWVNHLQELHCVHLASPAHLYSLAIVPKPEGALGPEVQHYASNGVYL